MTDNNDYQEEYDEEVKKTALVIVGEAFMKCEEANVSGIMAIGAFLDHIICHLVSRNGREMTSDFLIALSRKVMEGIYDPVAPDESISGGGDGGEGGG